MVYRDSDDALCGTEPVKYSEGVYIVYTEDITAANFGTKYRAVITYNGEPAQTAYYSVNSYVHSMHEKDTSIRELVRTLCNYGK